MSAYAARTSPNTSWPCSRRKPTRCFCFSSTFCCRIWMLVLGFRNANILQHPLGLAWHVRSAERPDASCWPQSGPHLAMRISRALATALARSRSSSGATSLNAADSCAVSLCSANCSFRCSASRCSCVHVHAGCLPQLGAAGALATHAAAGCAPGTRRPTGAAGCRL